ncbi:hypothetical protein NIES4073_45000 [Kalymmatonema gypsitolerans NIES-4073]|jgi:hypothetical protein|nr:hypothetical protein NIES4073_45000 [Scytonema sp. NIES-4073]
MILAISSSFLVGLVTGLVLSKPQKIEQKKVEATKIKSNHPGWLESASYIVGKYDE